MKSFKDWLKEQPVSELVQDLIYDLVYLSLGDLGITFDVYVKMGRVENSFDGDFIIFLKMVVSYLDTQSGEIKKIEHKIMDYYLFSEYRRVIPYNEEFAIELFTPIIRERLSNRDFSSLVLFIQTKVKKEWDTIQVGRFYEEATCVWRVVQREM